jgi:hypothetical protein
MILITLFLIGLFIAFGLSLTESLIKDIAKERTK